ncbi:hypothetical protein BH23PLA1_BH23PLA1_11030 [soil metagenome]
MSFDAPEGPGDENTPRLGGKTPLLAALIYSAAVVVATWPFVLTIGSRLPSDVDPLQHLWVLRWYQSCMLEGKSPLHCPDIQAPVGASIGFFSPLHLQALLFMPTSIVSGNDALAYNLAWFAGFLLTGLGTFALAWHVLRQRASAIVSGLLAMLSGPVLVHSHAHIELIFVGSFPIFLLAWMRLIDRPGPTRLVLAVAGYLLVAMSAAYFMVFAIFPAALYVAWGAFREGRRGAWPWLRARLDWLMGFGAASLPLLLLLFAGQVSAAMSGESMVRPRSEFDRFAAPWWGYLVPTPGHGLSNVLPSDPYQQTGTTGEGMAYLGLATLLLLAWAAIRRASLRDSGYWWISLAVLVVLSMGSAIVVGGVEVELPAGWLRDTFFPFRLIRAPARFKFFSAVVAAILAGAGLKHLLQKVRWSWAQGAIVSAVGLIALADLSHVPYASEPLPEMPGSYCWALAQDPDATFLEVPQFSTGGADRLAARAAYWQSIHGGKTVAGYSGYQNVAQDHLLTHNSPFLAGLLAQPGYPAVTEGMGIDILGNVSFLDYAWLYLKAHDLRFLVLHRTPEAYPAGPLHLDRLESLLAEAAVFEDESTRLYDRERLPKPRRAVAICKAGWNDRLALEDRFVCLTAQVAEVVVYNPEPDRLLRIGIDARSYQNPRILRLLNGPTEIYRWDVNPETSQLHVSPPFALPEGLSRLTLECEGAEPVHREIAGQPIRGPVALIVAGLSLVPEE